MSDVVILGVGQVPVGEHWELSLRQLAARAIRAARAECSDLKPQAIYIGNVMASILSRQSNLGAAISEYIGLVGVEATTVEAAGASGGGALHVGYVAVKSGLVDVALVLGLEKYTDQIGAAAESAVATTLDSDYESMLGMTPVTQAALLMRRYLQAYKAPRETFAGFPLTAHANAMANPNAMYRKPISLETYQKADVVCDPLNMFDIAPYADGAAALILTRSELVPKDWPHPPIRIAASSVIGDTLALHDRPDPLDLSAARTSTEQAFRHAGISRDQVDLFELYDAASIYAAMSLEAAGFAAPGTGWKLAQDGSIGLKGRLPVSTLGGLKGRGNPLGATGVYQAVEAVQQLRGAAGKNQVKDAQRALLQCWGGPASTVITHILERQS